LIISNFEVATFNREGSVEAEISRNFPLALIRVAVFKPNEWLSLVAGSGVELESNENLLLIKLGAEAAYPINEKSEIFLEISYDYKPEYYNSWGLFLGVARKI
jgi:hypothetical protein